ncbi:PEP-CTERM sorting domain-containing protein [Roseateles albus]|uniref:PEP-CTERM sorting domain-containing protein n=1 Tax=Roseateles albus TaxID=2987525 RepID=A0ABT5K8X5_9BURK|nr:PEP-CTERM sorting domain-containing protein [Roseateles albus]MDC8770230.1 PEP-CTERM sorting domain-containing protein [Roseateles albus]
MRTTHRLFVASAIALLSASSFALPSVWTTPDDHVDATHSYLENFNAFGESDAAVSAGNGYGFTASAIGDTYFNLGALSTNKNYVALTLDFTGADVHALRGKFFATDYDGTFFQSVTYFEFTLSNNSVEKFEGKALVEGGITGFYSSLAIKKLTFSVEDGTFDLGQYAAIDDLQVGAVPEPSSVALLGLGLAGVAFARRRRAA